MKGEPRTGTQVCENLHSSDRLHLLKQTLPRVTDLEKAQQRLAYVEVPAAACSPTCFTSESKHSARGLCAGLQEKHTVRMELGTVGWATPT